ncbi:MAG: Cna B-type domain-containing protein, partial [Erysipelotrichaceae bacterium]|nr:Cna B-type domain-containing protein [Erysipelotrichaceae bacterium]
MQKLISLAMSFCLLFNSLPTDSLTQVTNAQERVLICEQEEHTHEESCYQGEQLVCTAEVHQHTDACYQVNVKEETEEPSANKTDTYYVTDLKECVGSFKLYDKDGNEIPLDGSATVNAKDVYRFVFAFEESASGAQWGKTVTYTLPNGMQFCESFEREVILRNSEQPVATLHVDKASGKITVTFFDVEDEEGNTVPWPELSLESEISAEMEGKFTAYESEEQREIEIGADVNIIIDVDAKSTLGIKKSSGGYDADTHTFTYTVEVNAIGKVNDVVLKDTFNTYLELVEDSVQVDGKPAAVKVSGNTFTVELGNMADKETKKVTYKMHIKDSYINKSNAFSANFQNTASATGTDVTEVKSTVTTSVKQTHLAKDGTFKTIDGVEYCYWTITVDLTGMTDQTITIKDTLSGKHALANPMNWEGPIQLNLTMADGSTKTMYASDLSEIKLPDHTKKATITLYTKPDEVITVGAASYRNDVEVVVKEGKWSTGKTITKGGITPGTKKEILSADEGKEEGYITYRATITVPAGMDKNDVFYLEDNLRFMPGDYYVKQTPEDITITVNGKPFTDYKIYNANNGKFQILFGITTVKTDGNSWKNSKWPFAEDATLVVEYRVSRESILASKTGETIDSYLKKNFTLRNGIIGYYGDVLGRKNTSEAIVFHKESHDGTIEKTVGKVDQEKHTISYMVKLNPGLYSEAKTAPDFLQTSVMFTDTFDTRLEYVSGSLYVERYNPNNGKVEETFKPVNTSDVAVNGNQFTVDLAKLKGTNLLSYRWNPTMEYRVYYTLKIKDSEYNDVIAVKDAYVPFNNTAQMEYYDEIKTANATAEYWTGILDKISSLENGDTLKYTIDFNKAQVKFATTNENLHLVDTVGTQNVSLKPETIHVYKVEDGEKKELKNCYTIKDGGKTIDFELPDATYIIIEYAEKVVDTGTLDIVNTVYLEGYENIKKTDDKKVTIASAHSSASGDHGKFTVFKTNKDTGEPLTGAAFKLYTRKTNSVNRKDTITYNNETYYCALEFETNEQGWATVDHVVLTMKDADTYLLVETKAPDNFVLDKTPLAFVFNPKDGTTPEVYVRNEGSLTIGNEHKPISITVTKIWDDENDVEHIRPEEIEVYLYANGELADTVHLTK